MNIYESELLKIDHLVALTHRQCVYYSSAILTRMYNSVFKLTTNPVQVGWIEWNDFISSATSNIPDANWALQVERGPCISS